MDEPVYRPDLSLRGKLRRRTVRLYHRREATTAPPRAMVSFAFDDAPASAAAAGAAVLEQRGLRGTYFISAGLAGTTGHMGPYASRGDVERLSAAGHEIACHTFSHLDCGDADAASVSAEIDRNAEAFAEWGLPAATTFAYPFGDVGAGAKRAIDGRFSLARALHPGVIRRGSDLNQAPAIRVEGEGGEASALGWLGRAARVPGWVILFTHGVEREASAFGTTERSWSRLADECLRLGFEVVTVAQGAARMQAA